MFEQAVADSHSDDVARGTLAAKHTHAHKHTYMYTHPHTKPPAPGVLPTVTPGSIIIISPSG